MKGKRRSRAAVKKRNSNNKGSSRKLDYTDVTGPQENEISIRSSVGTNRTISLEKEAPEKFESSETELIHVAENGTRGNSRNVHISTTERNVYHSKNSVSSTIQTRRNASQNVRWNKETNGDSKKMKNYVVTRSVSSKRESMKCNKNAYIQKAITDADPNALSLAVEPHHEGSVNRNSNDYAEDSVKSRESANSLPYAQNKEAGNRESKKRERKEDDTYKSYTREREDMVKRQRRQDRKTNHLSDELYMSNNETSFQIGKEKIDRNLERGKEVKKEGRVLRGRKEANAIEKEKRGRGGHHSYGQQYSSSTEKKNAGVHTSKDTEEAAKNYGLPSEINDTHKYNEELVAVENEKSRDRRREKHHSANSVNGSVEKPVERSRRSNVKLDGDGVAKKMDKLPAGVHEGRSIITEGGDDITIKRGKSAAGLDRKEMAIEMQHGTNTLEENGKSKFSDNIISAEKGNAKSRIEGKEERNLSKENGHELENKNDDLLKSSYIKNGRVLRNLNRNNVSNDNTRTNVHRNTRNDKSEVSLCNIITSRRKRKNTEEAYAAAAENEKNKNHAKTSNHAANNTSKRKPKKGKRTTRRGAANANVTNTATKTSTRNTTARNANAAASQHNERRGNHVTIGTSDVMDEHQKQRGSGAANHTNQSGKVNVAVGTDPYNQPVSHSTRFRERQAVQLEEPEQKKRKKRVTEEGSKESSKINVGENYQVQTLPTFFLCRPELVYDAYDNSDSDDNDEQQCFECAGLPCHCKSGEPKLVYSPLMLERVKERCLKSRGYHKCVKNEMELSAYVQECAKSWKTNTDEWIPFSPEYAYKLLHYANYDPLKAISLMKSRDFSFRKILDPPTRKYQNKWKPKDKRDQLSKSPFPSPLTIRNYLSKRHHNSGYHLR